MQVISRKEQHCILKDLVLRLNPLIFNPLLTDPLDIARRDYFVYILKVILTHDGDSKRRLLMKYRVQRLGFYEEEDHTWELFKTLRLIPCLHQYLSNSNLKSLIPKEFRVQIFAAVFLDIFSYLCIHSVVSLFDFCIDVFRGFKRILNSYIVISNNILLWIFLLSFFFRSKVFDVFQSVRL